MRIKAARIEGPELVLTTEGREAASWAYGFKPGDYDIVPRKKKRSLDANNYAWVLIDKLAEATGYKVTDIYRDHIRDVGGISDYVCVRDDSVESFCADWMRGHIGRQAEVLRDADIPGCKVIVIYLGSSDFTTRQMSQLIDHLIEDCRALGIETMPPDRLQSLLEAWDGKKGK